MKAPILIAIENRRAIAKIMNDAMVHRGLPQSVDDRQLHVRPRYIAELTGNQGKISNAILDFMFPRENDEVVLEHFTSLDALTSIARTNELRLYAVSKRIGEGEMRQFAEDHDLKGYIDDTDGPPLYRELAEDLFYTSFTPPGTGDQTNHWDVFGGQGSGVRLKFRIKAKNHAELRAINYQAPQRMLLKEINDRLLQASYPAFVPRTISKIGAFYLHSTLVFEDEVRLLIKRHKGGRNDAKSDGTHEYWPLTLGRDDWFGQIDLIEIMCGVRRQVDDIAAVLVGTNFSNMPIVAYSNP